MALDDYAINLPLEGAPAVRVPPLEHDCAIAGLRLIAQPPGRVEVAYVTDVHILDVNLNAVASEWAAGGDRMRRSDVPADSIG